MTPPYEDVEIVVAVDTADFFRLILALAIADITSDEEFDFRILSRTCQLSKLFFHGSA